MVKRFNLSFSEMRRSKRSETVFLNDLSELLFFGSGTRELMSLPQRENRWVKRSRCMRLKTRECQNSE